VVAERGGCERGKFWDRGKASGAVEYGGLGRAVCELLVLTSGSEDKPHRGWEGRSGKAVPSFWKRVVG